MTDEHSYISRLTSSPSESEQESSSSQITQIWLPRNTLTDEFEAVESLGSASNIASLNNSEISEPANDLDPLPNPPIGISQAPSQEFQRQNCVELTSQTENIETSHLLTSATEHVEFENASGKSKLLFK